ncbi:MAG: hypothetical protein HY248_00325 [Fimbriimonas ginsengisoli]|uniref:Sodium:solute symporter family protein n=1 Tax=Fimbriimonas ginsengisoli TaxID=1005039 RepID=A0A931LTB7_FIMGI|nr:hypothetical protein [Fimbriimonas ginsengisoli]MBI3720970.1 hypothetical protein [Fimbriimonas ginsengisoli]
MPQVHLGPADAFWLAVLGLAIVALGFSARLRDRTMLQFLVAGRRLSMPAFVATLVTTWYGGILGVGEAVSTYGIGTWLLLGVPYYVFALVYAFWFAERVRSAEQISLPERLELRWGRGAALTGAVLVFLLAVPAAHVLMLGILVQVVTGWQLGPSVLVGALVGTLFLAKGGLIADVRVSFLAFAMMYVGFIAMALVCLHRTAFGVMLASIPDPKLHRLDGGQGMLAVLSFFLLGAWTLVDPGFHQRVAAAGSPTLGRRGVLVSVGLWMLFDVLSITAGLYAVASAVPAAKPLWTYPLLAEAMLPPGLKGIFLFGLLGTILSACVGYTLVSGATLGREIAARLARTVDDQRIRQWTRIGLFVSAGAAVGLSLWIESVVELWYDWAGALVGALLLPVAIAYGVLPGRRVSPQWASASMAIAFVLSMGWLIYGKRTGNDFLEVVLGNQRFSLGTLAPALVVSALILGIGSAIGRRQMA